MYLGLSRPKHNTLHLPLLNLTRFIWAHFASLPMSFWMTFLPSVVSAVPFSLVPSVNLLRVHPIPSSISLIKMMKCISPRKNTDSFTHLHSQPTWSPAVHSCRASNVPGFGVACREHRTRLNCVLQYCQSWLFDRALLPPNMRVFGYYFHCINLYSLVQIRWWCSCSFCWEAGISRPKLVPWS